MDQELRELKRLAKLDPYDTVIAERLERWLLRSGYVNPIVTLEQQLRNKVLSVAGKPNAIMSDYSFKSLLIDLNEIANTTQIDHPFATFLRAYPSRTDIPVLNDIPANLTYFNLKRVIHPFAVYSLKKDDSVFCLDRYQNLQFTKPSGKIVSSSYVMQCCKTNGIITIGFEKEHSKNYEWDLLKLQDTVKQWESKAVNCIKTKEETVKELADKLLENKTAKLIPVFKRYNRWTKTERPIMPSRIKKNK